MYFSVSKYYTTFISLESPLSKYKQRPKQHFTSLNHTAPLRYTDCTDPAAPILSLDVYIDLTLKKMITHTVIFSSGCVFSGWVGDPIVCADTALPCFSLIPKPIVRSYFPAAIATFSRTRLRALDPDNPRHRPLSLDYLNSEPKTQRLSFSPSRSSAEGEPAGRRMEVWDC